MTQRQGTRKAKEKSVFDREKEQARAARAFTLGNTRVYILTDYCEDKTREDVQKILDRIARNALNAFRAAGMYVQETGAPKEGDAPEGETAPPDKAS